eukprot:131941-Pyramimonas_sp.AAC.1
MLDVCSDLRLCGEREAHVVLGRLPWRCLRARWGSIDCAENAMIKSMKYLGAVMSQFWPLKAADAEPASAKTAWAGEYAECSVNQRNYRINATKCTNDVLWKPLLLISNAARKPVVNMLFGSKKWETERGNNAAKS